MGVKIDFKPDLLEAAIRQIGDRAIKGMSGKMRQIAIRMRDLAREYAPTKTGLLEESIDYAAIPGKRGRLSFVVFIDLDAPRRDAHRRGGELGDYAFIMEEELHPYGVQKGARYFTLGPKSQAKASRGRKVGGRFLSRAFRAATKDIEREMAAEVRRVLNSGRLAPVGYQRETNDEDEE